MMVQAAANCRGVCLAEMLIALAAGLVVLAATLQTLDLFERRLSKQHAAAAQMQDLRVGLTVLEEELRAAEAGTAPQESPLSVSGREEIEFSANLGGLATTLAAGVSSMQQDLPVSNGTGWLKGKRILVCDRERCVENRLARDGGKTSLSLMAPLGREFPPGSTVRVLNQVRYYVKTDRSGQARVMREVDGGANPLIGAVARFQFRYFARDGVPTAEPSRVARVRIEAAVGDERVPVVRDIGLRGR